MTDLPRPGLPRARGLFALPLGTFAGFAAAFAAAVVVAFMSYRSPSERAPAAGRVTRSLQLISQAQALLATIVQQPESAQALLMPASALRLFTPTHVLALDGIAALLATLSPTGLAAKPARGDEAAGTRPAGEGRR